MNTSFHQASAADAIRTAILSSSGMAEQARAEGFYTVECFGPREIDRPSYIVARDALTDLQGRGLASRLWNGRQIKSLEDKLAGFELVKQWSDIAPNVVVTVGKNLALDTYLSGSVYTVVGPYLGLIGAASYTTGPAAGDTMASHGGWTEAGVLNAPTYSGTRKTAAFSAAAAGAKALSSALVFSMTGTGTVKGCFLVYGTGAVNPIDSTAGTLYSAGLFTGGDQPVVNGNTLNVSYSTSL